MGKVNGPTTCAAVETKRPVPQIQPLWQSLPWVMALGFGLRLAVVVLSEKLLHPDEVFQYLEQAHRLVFGYGIVPWEYVHGIRSWLLPLILALPLWLTQRLGINDPDLYIPVIQGLACWISLTAIFCAYWIGRQLYSESVGRIASVLTAVWWEMVFWGHKATPEIFGMYLLLGAFACLVTRPNRWLALLFGVCSAGTVAFRLQYAPAVAVLVMMALGFGWRRQWALHHVLFAAWGFLAVVLLVGWLDDYTWGGWWISYANNYLYNRIYGVSSIWGEHPVYFYPLELGLHSAGLFWVAIAAGLFFKLRKTWLILALIVAIMLPHTLIPHKEYRFITAVIPLGLVLFAAIVDDLWQNSEIFSLKRAWSRPLAIGFTVYVLVGTIPLFAFVEREASLRAYLYLNDQPNLTSLLNLRNYWFSTGGYYYLHRDIPIYYSGNVVQIDQSQWSNHFSHIICDSGQAPIPGFVLDNRIGNLDIRVTTTSPHDLLPTQNRFPLQHGIDGVYVPRVAPRF